MSSDEAKILAILEDILTSGGSAEDGCRHAPDLLPEIKVRLAQMLVLEAHLDEVLPMSHVPDHPWPAPVADAMADLPVIPGYEVEAVVGSGGMGVVYRGRHLKLKRTVAIKMLLAGGYAGRSDLERFKREAESIAALQHPNIVQVFDAGDWGGRPYFVMEFMDGGTLAQRLAGTPQPARGAAELIRSLAIAIHAAHTAGIVHRDLKPANLLLSSDGTVKVADFGLAGRSDPAGSAVTLIGVRMGTPSYMAPEQATGAPTASSPLVDVYALGVLLYEMLTGRPPFRGENAAETERQVVTAEPVPPSRLNPRTPRDLQTITLRCLCKDPARRYQSALELSEDLERFLRGSPILARPVGTVERAMKWCRRQPGRAALIAALFIAMAATTLIGVRLQTLRADRRAESVLQQGRAQVAVESALALAQSLRRGERWAEAQSVLGNAGSRLPDANSPDLEARLAAETENLEIAQELDRIGQGFPEPYAEGYNYSPASEGYKEVFERLGMGPGVSVEEGAQRVRISPLRDPLLIALDTAAFLEQFNKGPRDQDRLLSMARLADPDPWRDRFRDPTLWEDREGLLKLAVEARSPSVNAPAHQIVLLGILLGELGESAKAVEIFREAQYQHPSDFWIALGLGNALARAGSHAEAIQYYRSAVALRPSNYAAWATLGSEVAKQESPAAALPLFQRVVELNPHHMVNWHNVVLALSECERWEDAQGAIKKAAELNPGDPRVDGLRTMASLIHARSLASTGHWEDAARLYADSAHKHPDDAEVWFEYTAALLLANDSVGYRQACKHMVDRGEAGRMRTFLAARAWTLTANSPDDFDRVNRMGMQELNQSAAEHWSLTEQAALMCRNSQYAEAELLLQRSIAAKPAGAVLNWSWLAVAEARQGHRTAALDWLGKTETWLEQNGGKSLPGIHLHDWLEAQALRREAASALRDGG